MTIIKSIDTNDLENPVIALSNQLESTDYETHPLTTRANSQLQKLLFHSRMRLAECHVTLLLPAGIPNY